MHWTTACPDWEARICEGRPLIPFGPLFPEEAAKAREVFAALRIVDANGSPTIGEACRPWVFEFADAIFGSYDHSIGRRLIRDFLLLVAKKNSKSTIAAAIMLTALIRNWRKSAEFLILAPTIEIANNSFGPARDMVRAHETLSDLLHVQDHYRTITHRGTGATLKVVAADNETVGGKKAVGVLVDELWLFGKQPNAENMLREATGGLASRPEGFVVYLSTHSDGEPVGVFKQRLDYFRGVRDGRIKDKRALPALYEFPRPMLLSQAFREREHWRITNPNLGLSVDEEFLEREFAKAQEAGDTSLKGFFAKHLNVEISVVGSGGWAGAEFWQPRADAGLTLETILARSDVAVIGIDGGGLDDLLGLTVLGRDRDTRDWLSWSKAWAHRSVLQRRKSEASRLEDFDRSGELLIVDDLGEDIADLVAICQQVDAAGILHGVGLDPVGVGQIVDALAEVAIDGDRIIGVSQGWKLTGAIKTAERKLADGTLRHADQALMRWCVGNAKPEAKGNAVVITKQASGTAKIDPLMALFDAVALMSMNPDGAPVAAAMIV